MIQNIGNFKDNTDGTIKCVYQINNKIIEMSMLYNKEDRDVICVPTHHYCNLGCKMCHLTSIHTNQKMIPISSKDFIYCLKETLTKYHTDKSKLLISFMGVGEPLLNLKLLIDVFEKEKEIKKIGYKYISYAISTMMPNDELKRLTNIVNELNIPLKVHFSLHNPINVERKKLIPSSNININEALDLLKYYEQTIKKNPTIMKRYKLFHPSKDLTELHYTLINNLNDSSLHLNHFISLLSKYPITLKFIKFNPINNLEKSSKEEYWIQEINQKLPNLRVKLYSPPGREIGSSCGDFTKHYYTDNETKEELTNFNIWKKKHHIS